MKNEEVKNLFKRYLNGQIDAREEELLFRLISEHENSERLLEELMEQSWQAEPVERDESADATAGLAQVWEHIAQQRHKKKYNLASLFSYAASILLIFGAAFFWYISRKPTTVDVFYITKTTGAGEKVKLILADSSVVYLNALSRLSYPDHFEKNGQREIKLEGEAFFEVKHEKSRPFIVRSGKIQTYVLGTSFNITAYPEDKVYQVAVRSGKVGVAEEDGHGKLKHLSLLTRGEQLNYWLADSRYTTVAGKAEDYNAWINNRFIFRNARLADMLVSLERNYKVAFKVHDTKLKESRFNATFVNKNIKEIMEQLMVMSNGQLHYHINTHQSLITIGGRPLMN